MSKKTILRNKEGAASGLHPLGPLYEDGSSSEGEGNALRLNSTGLGMEEDEGRKKSRM
jgi:hypothetical protein